MSKSYKERIAFHTNPTAIKLLEIMETKKTNLCVAVDVTLKAELLKLADTLGPLICVLKVYIWRYSWDIHGSLVKLSLRTF